MYQLFAIDDTAANTMGHSRGMCYIKRQLVL